MNDPSELLMREAAEREQESSDQFVELDLLGREFRRAAPQAELASLREFNGKLLERIGEFRKRNHELSASENALRKALAGRDEENARLEREISAKHKGIETLSRELEERLVDFETSKADMNRKVANLSDQKWSDDLELESLRARDTAQFEELERQRVEIAELRAELGQVPLMRAELSERRCSEVLQAKQLNEANALLSDLELALEAGKIELQKTLESAAAAQAAAQASGKAREEHLVESFQAREVQLAQAFQAREAQLVGAFENLRAEYASIDKCYREAIEAVTQLRLEGEAGARRQVEAQRQLALHAAEISRLQHLLKAEDNRIETECRKLQTSQERVTYLDQHVRQIADATKREKIELLRIAKTLAQDLHVARTHPAHDYLRAVELEIAHLQSALSAASGLSPARMKFEVRLAQATEHREILRTLISSSERQHEERSQTIQAIIKSANAPV